MFGWLRKRGGASPPPLRANRKAPAAASGGGSTPMLPTAFQDTTPLPEVVGEGNTHADWSAWEDSMNTLDSQLQSVLPSDRVYTQDTRPSQLDELDPFSSVRGKRDK